MAERLSGFDSRAALHRVVDGVRERSPRTPAAGERVWRDDAAVVLRRVLPPLVVALVVMAAALTALGRLVTDVLDDSALGRADLELVREVARRRTGVLDAVAGVSTWLANTVFVLVVMAVGAVVAARATRRWVAPVFLVAAVAGEKLVYLIVSLAVGRERPPVPTLGFVHATTSFPSGHVGAAVSLYGAIALLVLWSPRASPRLRAIAVALGLAVPLLVGAARVYRGVHYVSDVVAGLLLGVAWLVVTWYVLARQFSPYGRLRPAIDRHS